MISSQSIGRPKDGVLENAPPGSAHDPEVELGDGVTLICGQPVSFHGIGIVFGHTLAVGVCDAGNTARLSCPLVPEHVPELQGQRRNKPSHRHPGRTY